ncbi:hypothetical protein [Desulfovibrio ferrophilus]|uniref:PilZ domain protein n=1 Tax=Desulfovibrio ferrophilus TaxID=241368 RepID=A0A2Z6B2A5_9BACT|nr:hypothetical protein [Desulfovibrio ferrophilus]BBD09649.1 PilZ domain protein [Desulfovibrio ferrophilus]
MLPNTRQPLNHLAATVCWTNNDEFGVAFNPELEISTAELQALIDART